MFAIVETGAKQHMVRLGQVFKAEKIDSLQGSTVVMNKVVAYGGEGVFFSGSKACADAGVVVECQILEQKRDKKIIIFKKKRRHNYRKKQGHRQSISILKVVAINVKK